MVQKLTKHRTIAKCNMMYDKNVMCKCKCKVSVMCKYPYLFCYTEKKLIQPEIVKLEIKANHTYIAHLALSKRAKD